MASFPRLERLSEERAYDLLEQKGCLLVRLRQMSADVNEELRNLSRKLKLYEKLMKEIEEINQRDVLTIFEEKFLVHQENHEEKVIPIEVIGPITRSGKRRAPEEKPEPKRRRGRKEKTQGYKPSDCDNMSNKELEGYLLKLKKLVGELEQPQPQLPSDNVSLPDGSSLDGLPSDQTSELEFDNDYPEEPEEPEEEERVGSPASNGSEKADAFEVERIIQVEKSENVSKKSLAFFIYWKNFGPHECSMATLEDMKGCQGKLHEFFVKEEGIRAVLDKMRCEGLDPKRMMLIPPEQILEGRKMSLVGWKRRLNHPLHSEQKKLWIMKEMERKWNLVTEKIIEPPVYLEVFHSDGFAKLPRTFTYNEEIMHTEKTDRLYRTINKKCSCSCGQELCAYCANKNHEPFLPLRHGPFEGFQDFRYSYMSKMCSKDSTCSLDCPSRQIPSRQVPLLVCYEPKIGGLGVRALTDIPAGTVIAEYNGEAFHEQELALFKRGNTSYQFEIKGETIIDAKKVGSVSRFFNHNCEPNVCYVYIYKGRRIVPKLYYATMRNIERGESLVIDYHCHFPTSHPEDTRPLQAGRLPNSSDCLCGSEYCRKLV